MSNPKRTVVKKVKNAVLYSDGSIRIDNVRASYPHWARAQEEKDDAGNKTGKKSFSVKGLGPTGTHKEAMQLCKEQVEKLLADNKLTGKVGKDKWFVRRGDDAKDEDRGNYTFSCREQKRPVARNADKSKLNPETDADVIYGGCYVNILLRPWLQQNKFGKRVNANFLAIQFVKDGEAFGEGRISESDIDDSFDDLEDDEENGGFDDEDEDEL